MARVIAITTQNRRRDNRRRVMLPALLNGQPVEIEDVSLGGISASSLEILSDEGVALTPGQIATLRLPRDSDQAQTLTLEIVRVSLENGSIGARIVGLDDREYRMIEKLVLGRGL